MINIWLLKSHFNSQLCFRLKCLSVIVKEKTTFKAVGLSSEIKERAHFCSDHIFPLVCALALWSNWAAGLCILHHFVNLLFSLKIKLHFSLNYNKFNKI